MFKGSDGIDSAPLALRDAISEFNSMAILFGVTIGMKVLTGVEQISKTVEHINETMKGTTNILLFSCTLEIQLDRKILDSPPIRHNEKFVVPYERNEYFRDRKDVMAILWENLNDSKPGHYNHRVALHVIG